MFDTNAHLCIAKRPHILVVDDDERIRELLGAYLQNNHYHVTLAHSAQQAALRMDQLCHDLMILDVMMPGQDGLTFLNMLRQSVRPDALMPTILLTARGQVEDRLAGLSVGADDYLPKPFEPQELLLRIRAVLKRVQPSAPSLIHFGPWHFVRATRQLFRGDQHVTLTTAEESLLHIFCERPGQMITREDLTKLQDTRTLERSMDVQINRLRRKIEHDPKHPRYLQTIRHKGYIFYCS